MSNMRIAVAGSCGLALIIAREIHESTSHQLVLLSRIVSFSDSLSLSFLQEVLGVADKVVAPTGPHLSRISMPGRGLQRCQLDPALLDGC
jgi:hypothetical protein